MGNDYENKRKDNVFVDYLCNAYAQTSVCTYSLHANSSAGIATPLEWKELDKVTSGDYCDCKNIFRRLGQNPVKKKEPSHFEFQSYQVKILSYYIHNLF